MYHRRKTIKMRQEEQMMLASKTKKMMQWRHKPKHLIRKLLKKENRLAI
jgi:hypothetical protein